MAPRGIHVRDKINKQKPHARQTARSGSWMEHAQLTWSSHQQNDPHPAPTGHSGKETPRSSPLFIYSRCSPADIPLTLPRRPRNKHTGQGGGSLGRGEVVEIDTALAKAPEVCFRNETELYFCTSGAVKVLSSHNKGARLWRVHEMLGMCGMA